jgi:flagellar hook assembly protein FlgD
VNQPRSPWGHPQYVNLCIFDMKGKRITVLADRAFQAGTHSLEWQGKDLQGRTVASGNYILRIVTDKGQTTEKMMLIR